jgi:hypothetical protein
MFAAPVGMHACMMLLFVDEHRYWKMFDSPNVVLEVFALFDAVFARQGERDGHGAAENLNNLVDPVIQEATRLLKSVLDEGPSSIPELFSAASALGLPMRPE